MMITVGELPGRNIMVLGSATIHGYWEPAASTKEMTYGPTRQDLWHGFLYSQLQEWWWCHRRNVLSLNGGIPLLTHVLDTGDTSSGCE